MNRKKTIGLVVLVIVALGVIGSFMDDPEAESAGQVSPGSTSSQSRAESGPLFPDPNLEALIREDLDLPEGPFTTSRLNQVAMLFGGKDKGISSLEGMQKLTRLTILTVSHNKIQDLSPLAGLTRLQYLDLQYNQIQDLSALSKLTSLTTLDLESNQISDLSPLANLNRLNYLNLKGNRVKDITPIRDLRLSLLDLTNNPIDMSVGSANREVLDHLREKNTTVWY